MKDTLLRVYYVWEGTDGCGDDCIDKDWNIDLFTVSFMKGRSLLKTKRIVPCELCDKTAII